MTALPSTDDVRRIAEMADPVLRNLAITACYARLSAATSARTGQACNWCTFSTWASRQAGATIRGEDLLDGFERRLRAGADLLHPIRSTWRALLRRGVFSPGTRLGAIVGAVHTPFDAFERAGAAVARGNVKIFSEMAHAFARYLAETSREDRPDSTRFHRFLEALTPGDPPDGQRYLRQAFARYQQQLFEPDPRVRRELLALANLEIGLHEQVRVQPEIVEALHAPLVTKRDLRGRLLDALLPSRGIVRTVLGGGPFASAAAALAEPLARVSERLAREVITERLMVLTLPGGLALRLGRPLDQPIPESLRAPASMEFQTFLSRFEVCTPSTPHAADDWSDLSQRMHYIVHLFCAFHEDPRLHQPPFTDAQLRAITDGMLPAGAL